MEDFIQFLAKNPILLGLIVAAVVVSGVSFWAIFRRDVEMKKLFKIMEEKLKNDENIEPETEFVTQQNLANMGSANIANTATLTSMMSSVIIH